MEEDLLAQFNVVNGRRIWRRSCLITLCDQWEDQVEESHSNTNRG